MKRSSVLLVMVTIALLIVSCSGEGGIGVVEINPYAIFMKFISEGDFWMGDTKGLSAPDSPTKPHHQVTFTYDYYIQKLEVTNDNYLDFLNDNPVTPTGVLNGHQLIDTASGTREVVYMGGEFHLEDIGKSDYPVHSVSWWGAIEYCNWMSREYGLDEAYNVTTGQLITSSSRESRNITQVEGFRLPTEAEWEYAARGAENDYFTTTDYLYAGSDFLDSYGWFLANSNESAFPIASGKGTHVVGSKNPNEIGLSDMSGNVYEWCHDWYSTNYYSLSPDQNPTGPLTGDYRVVRGGGWGSDSIECRTYFRNHLTPTLMIPIVGFRIAKTK